MRVVQWIIGCIITVVIILAYISLYNGLVKAKTWVREAWIQVDIQLEIRNDLVPKLIETIKDYTKQEQEIVTQVIQLRNKLQQLPSENRLEKMQISNQLSEALNTIFSLRESYENLEFNENFKKIQEELATAENTLAYSRQLYNSSVTSHNIKLQALPSNLIGKLHGFEKIELLETPPEYRIIPKVTF